MLRAVAAAGLSLIGAEGSGAAAAAGQGTQWLPHAVATTGVPDPGF